MPMLLTQALKGERVTIYDRNGEGWAWGQLAATAMSAGFPMRALARPAAAPTHKITALRTFAFPGPSIKLPPADTLPMGAKIDRRARGRRLRRHARRLVSAAAASRRSRRHETISSRSPNASSARPISGAARAASASIAPAWSRSSLNAAGTGCPRDSDMQQDGLGRALDAAETKKLQRGDLIFWKGHVAIVRDADTIVHANAHHMATVIENTREAIARIKAAGSEIIGDQAAHDLSFRCSHDCASPRPPAAGFEPERGRKQRAGVIGLRVLEQLRGRPFLHHLAVAHHDQMAGQRGDHAQIVRDEHVGQVALALQLAQQIDHLRLEQHVERAGRLVQHDEIRLQHHGARDADALALAAGEFVRIAKPRRRIEADILAAP